MSWDYRVVKRKYKNEEETHGIYEVYYDDEDNPRACTESPIQIESFNLNTLKKDLKKIREAFQKPVLNYETFEEMENGENSLELIDPDKMENEPPEITKKVNENIWDLFSDE